MGDHLRLLRRSVVGTRLLGSQAAAGDDLTVARICFSRAICCRLPETALDGGAGLIVIHWSTPGKVAVTLALEMSIPTNAWIPLIIVGVPPGMSPVCPS